MSSDSVAERQCPARAAQARSSSVRGRRPLDGADAAGGADRRRERERRERGEIERVSARPRDVEPRAPTAMPAAQPSADIVQQRRADAGGEPAPARATARAPLAFQREPAGQRREHRRRARPDRPSPCPEGNSRSPRPASPAPRRRSPAHSVAAPAASAAVAADQQEQQSRPARRSARRGFRAPARRSSTPTGSTSRDVIGKQRADADDIGEPHRRRGVIFRRPQTPRASRARATR